ncbi:SH3 domain-containing protein [Bartonella sp. CB169]|uniref:SH3 domain-containing protein n=1 Tax=Bartonella sp. CB169 TaxID=3112257 RepID=UPI003FA5CBB4
MKREEKKISKGILCRKMKKLIIFFIFCPFFLATTASKAVDAFVTRNLNFRTGPSIQHVLHSVIPAGALVFVQSCKGDWCHIKYNTKTGWVSARYLSFKDGNNLYHTYTNFQ